MAIQVDERDNLRVDLTSSDTGDVGVHWSILREDGRTVLNQRLVINHAGGDRSTEVFRDFEMVKGTLEGVVISGPGASKRGTMHAIVYIERSGIIRAGVCKGPCVGFLPLLLGQFTEPTEGKGLRVTNEAASTLVNNTALTRTITVPTDARWGLHGGQAFNADDVTRAVFVDLDDGAEIVYRYHGGNVGASAREIYPSQNSHAEHGIASPFPLAEADRILITFSAGGSSAGGTARSSAVVEEWIEP